ncbi:hypothetical protein CDL12_15831 [Handroanthus impetiginosus]|uniref:J domain-containing protein n=1 Tax=Handroanthus impetiginosus TaxID=429701 RepID=A0A2G9H247_9LAMI|nr:hypothetical protein CDL12_15831 [Handroanthus impetiginosus]
MQVLPRWRNILIPKNTITQSTRVAVAATTSTNHLASFHSTNVFFEKWRNKFNFDVGRDQQPSKNYIRYAVRQKRADTKKALKSILFNGGCSASKPESFSKIEADYADKLNKKSRIKPARQAKRAHHKKLKRKHRRENLFDDFDENSERIFHATFGKRGFTWTFRPSEMGFDWTESASWSNNSFDERYSKSRIESDDEPFVLGTYAERKILGLPTTGPLKIEDVKAAFRLSALKWHPDKHQGSSQAEAEEKFKLCVNAYKSLCNALSTA